MVSKNLTLKLATAADAGVIAVMARDLVEQGLVWSWTPQRVARHLGNRDTLTVLACDGPTIVGFAIMYMGDQHAHLNLLAVRPAYRAAGVGPRLLEWLKTTCLTAGVAVIYCEIRVSNELDREGYTQFGFEETGTVPRYYGGVEAAVCMALRLRSESAEG